MPRKAPARALRGQLKPEDDPTSLGSILVNMGVLSEDSLKTAVFKQKEASPEEQLGFILISMNLCTQEQVHTALQSQEGMRSPNKKEQALAVARLAEDLRNRTIAESHRIVARGNRYLRSATGDAHPAITPAMLAKPDR